MDKKRAILLVVAAVIVALVLIWCAIAVYPDSSEQAAMNISAIE